MAPSATHWVLKTAALLVLLPAPLLAQDDDPWSNEQWDDEGWGQEEEALPFNGFVEAAAGTRFTRDPLLSKRETLEELRWRLETEWNTAALSLRFKSDLAYDGIEKGWDAEFRDLTVGFRIGESIDARIGQQVLTWGTGDLVFLNDLFPKDFVSFFAGRDDDYLKAPSATLRFTRFSDTINIDVAWTPLFEPDVYLNGERFSFFSPLAGSNVSPDPPLAAVEPSDSLSNGELAVRLFKTVEGREYALYAYDGFFKQPTALTAAFEPTFAALTAIGASLRQPAGPGLVNFETAYYWSRDDKDGTDPLLPNDQLRLLAGYEWEPKANFTVGLQYYLEWTRDHDALIRNSPAAEFEPDELRHVLTTRLSFRAGLDRHVFSLFAFISPSDRDFYLRPSYQFRYSDEWSWVLGGNLFGGDAQHTFFSQLQDASNAYLRIRYHY
ncbi:MAG: hypothetical protein AAFX56_02550 [Pseudomonadota bacterium]